MQLGTRSADLQVCRCSRTEVLHYEYYDYEYYDYEYYDYDHVDRPVKNCYELAVRRYTSGAAPTVAPISRICAACRASCPATEPIQ